MSRPAAGETRPSPVVEVLVGPVRLELRAPSPLLDHLRRLFAAFPAPSRPAGEHGRAELVADITPAGDDGFDLVVNGHPRLAGVALWAVEDRLLANLNGWLLAREADRLHLHAALVSRNGVGALLVAPGGSGKSTFTAHLVGRGWTYHTDECAAVVPRTGRWGSYPRPLTLKAGSWPRFGHLPSVGAALADASDGRDRVHVPPGELGGPTSNIAVPVAVVAFVDHRTAGSSDDLAPSAAFLRLVADALDLGRAASRGIDDLATLVAQARAVEVSTQDLDAAERRLAHLIDTAPAPPSVDGHAVHGIATLGDGPLEPMPAAAVRATSVVRRRHQVCSAVLPDGGVLYDMRNGTVVPVNPSGLRVWSLLEGDASLDELVATTATSTGADVDEVRPAILGFVRDVAAAGLVSEIGPT